MQAKKMIRVRAVPGRLYPHPDGARLGHRGWLGWTACQQSEAEHTIEGAAGIARKDGATGQVYDAENTTSDMFARGPDIFLRRDPEGAIVEEDIDIRRGLRSGDLEQVCEICAVTLTYGQSHTCQPSTGSAAIPPVPSLPRGRGR